MIWFVELSKWLCAWPRIVCHIHGYENGGNSLGAVAKQAQTTWFKVTWHNCYPSRRLAEAFGRLISEKGQAPPLLSIHYQLNSVHFWWLIAARRTYSWYDRLSRLPHWYKNGSFDLGNSIIKFRNPFFRINTGLFLISLVCIILLWILNLHI